MRVGASGIITALTEDDLPEAEALLTRAFQVPSGLFGRRLRRYLALNPRTWLILRASRSAAAVGVVGANVFGGCAYIGLMGIDPSAQRQGHGERLMRVLMERLPDEGAHTFLLDASSAGAPLYARLGFVTVGHAGEWHRAGSPEGEATVPAPAARADLARDTTLDDERYVLGQLTSRDDEREVAVLDKDFFGFDRTSLWTRLGQEEEAIRTLVLRDEHARGVGYLCLQQGLLAGPFGAATPRAAAALLRSALSQESSFARGGRVLVPSDNADAPALLRQAGFHETRRLAHMRLVLPEAPRPHTEEPPPLWSRIYGKGSFCLG